MNSGEKPNIYNVSKKSLWDKKDSSQTQAKADLPVATRDIVTLKTDLDTHGYCLVENALSDNDVVAVRDRLNQQWLAEQRIGRGIANPTGVHSVCNLLNKGKIFQKIVLHPIVDELLEYMLGDGFLISALCGAQTVPGSKAQGLHIDQFLFGVPTEFPLVGNAMFMLDDFTEENGATRVIPGSHKWSPEQVAEVYEGLDVANNGEGENPPGTIPALGKAGTCLVFEGRLVHGAGKNLTADRTRTGITSYYCRPWMRPFTNAFLSTPDDLMESFPPRLRAQLGYAPWGLAGGYESPGMPAPMDTVRPCDQVRELD